MESKRNLLNHFKLLQQGFARLGGEALLNVKTFFVDITIANKTHKLYPQFFVLQEGKPLYSHQFVPNALVFSGWRPYFRTVVPEVGQKLKFKEVVVRHGLLTPEYSRDGKIDGPVIIKKNISSFGDEIRGPFKSSAGQKIDVDAGQYFERFIPGEIAKIWFWNMTPVVVETKTMYQILGDGRTTIKELVVKKVFNKKKQPNWNRLEELLAFYGRNFDTVLAQGETQIVDFRYTSEFSWPREVNETVLPTDDKTFDPLGLAGQVIWDTLDVETRKACVFTIDAILDADKKWWLLECNFNPFVHPGVYPLMLASLVQEHSQPPQALATNMH